jgi:hypothetical protein
MYRLALSVVFALALAASAQELKKEPPKYKPGDTTRPRPQVIDPGSPTKPPADAVVLFDGKDWSEWTRTGKKLDAADAVPTWKIADGVAEISPRGGNIVTKKKFGDAQIHIEWATPAAVKGNGQGRGNSGVKLGAFGEVQILDSFENDTYPDGQAAALYQKFPPLVNASRKPGEWQSFDIITQLSRQDEAGKVERKARITVMHNGVLVHHAVELAGKVGEFSILLQDHGNPVRFRNVWVRKLGEYDEKK